MVQDHGAFMQYRLSRTATGMGVGWFSCVPEKELEFRVAVEYSRAHPNDHFMRKYLLEASSRLEPHQLEALIKKDDPFLLSLVYETCLVNEKFKKLIPEFDSSNIKTLAEYTPFIYIRWSMQDNKNQSSNLYWLRKFSENTNLHTPLPDPGNTEFPILFDQSAIDQWKAETVSIKEMAGEDKKKSSFSHRPAPRELARHLSQKLEKLGILTGWETRTEATLSPYAIERPWNLDITIDQGRNQLRLIGEQVSYGRGLNIHQARISCVMEAAERYSSFADISFGQATGYKKDHILIKASLLDMKNRGLEGLDPNRMNLEVPYENQEIYWIPAETGINGPPRTVYVPVQWVFLFPNLDEPALTSGLASNGLAAGGSMEEARLSALLEVIERDAEKVMPYCPDRCFLLEAEDEKIREIILGNRQKGINIQIVDMTSELGIPCYRAFIQGPGGVVLKGSGAHLDARRAVIAAITEIPYPYPYWFGSMAVPQNVPTLEFEELPDYSTGSVTGDLELLERLLTANGGEPLYADLTRKDLDIPVVKAIVPGLEIITFLDRYSRLSVRQFGNYLRAYERLDQA